MEGRQIDMETNKKQQYIILYQEKKINAEENRMKVDCVHFISKNSFAVGCQSEKSTKKDEDRGKQSMSEKDMYCLEMLLNTF